MAKVVQKSARTSPAPEYQAPLPATRSGRSAAASIFAALVMAASPARTRSLAAAGGAGTSASTSASWTSIGKVRCTGPGRPLRAACEGLPHLFGDAFGYVEDARVLADRAARATCPKSWKCPIPAVASGPAPVSSSIGAPSK